MTFSPEKIEAIQKLQTEGYNKTQIAQKLKISLSSVKRIIGNDKNTNIEQTAQPAAQPANTQNTAITPQQSNAQADNLVNTDLVNIILKLVNNNHLTKEEAAKVSDILVKTPSGYDLAMKEAIGSSLADPLKKSFVTYAMKEFDDIIKDGIQLHYLKSSHRDYLAEHDIDFVTTTTSLWNLYIEHKEENDVHDIDHILTTMSVLRQKEQSQKTLSTAVLLKIIGR